MEINPCTTTNNNIDVAIVFYCFLLLRILPTPVRVPEVAVLDRGRVPVHGDAAHEDGQLGGEEESGS